MVESRSHKSTDKKLTQKYKTGYNHGKGADIQTRNMAIEVETEGTVQSGLRQLLGHRKPVYVAGANVATVKKALEVADGSTVGVMDSQGNII
jgi:hypothetical protein